MILDGIMELLHAREFVSAGKRHRGIYFLGLLSHNMKKDVSGKGYEMETIVPHWSTPKNSFHLLISVQASVTVTMGWLMKTII